MQRFWALIIVMLGTLASVACKQPVSNYPELVLTGGVIYPLGDSNDPLPALAIHGDRVIALGNNAEILELAGPYTQQMNLEGSSVLAGTYDAWIDLEALGRWSSTSLDVRLASTIEEVQAMVRNASGTNTASEWIIGWGWDENDWPTPRLPDHSALDAVTTDRPILLLHRNRQSAWLNSLGIASLPSVMNAVNPDTMASVANNQTTGIVSGSSLDTIVDVLAGDATERAIWLGEGARHAASRGITRAGTTPVDTETIEALLKLEYQGLLPLRVDIRQTPRAALAYRGSNLERQVQESALINVTAVGLRLDGPLASKLAALTAPYEGHTTTGNPTNTSVVSAAVAASNKVGLPLHVHASGDRAMNTALNAIAESDVAGGMIIGFDLLPKEEGAVRAAGLNVAIAAARFSNDIYHLDELLGIERAARAHAWSDLVAAGAILSFASDAPTYELRPLATMATALTRQDVSGYPAGGWNASQIVSHTRLIRALIGNPGDSTTELVSGSAADLVVWSEDPMTDDPVALRRAEAMLTIVAGRVAYSRALVDLPMGLTR